MEKRLKWLFDYQRFARNPRLDAMLVEAEGRCAAIDDEDLAMVSAAGESNSRTAPVLQPPEEQT